MAKRPKEKSDSSAGSEKTAQTIKDFFEKQQKHLAEQNRTKNYEDLLKYAQNHNDLEAIQLNPQRFPGPLTISAQEAFSPYYGEDFEKQQAAAIEYAKQFLQKQDGKQPLVQIDPAYYEELKKQVPVKNAELQPHYNATKDQLVLPTPVDLANFEMSLSEESLSKNNYGTKADLAKAFQSTLGNYYRDTIEHEAGHIADKNVQFAQKPPQYYDTVPPKNLGYMGQENHLVTGLSKIQREQYSMTGSRFETPEQFKNFVFNLAESEDVEKAISGFSEEAKRALRPQIKNAKDVQKYNKEFEKWQKNTSWLKGKAPPNIPFAFDFFEKSAQLIPALVSAYAQNNYTT